MLSEVRVLGSRARARRAILERVDRLTRSQLEHTDLTAASQILSTARFSPHLPLVIAGTEMPDGAYAPDRTIGRALPYLAAVEHMARDHLGDAPIGSELAVGLEIDDGIPRFVAWIRNSEEVDL